MGFNYVPESAEAIREDHKLHDEFYYGVNLAVNFIAEKATKMADSMKAEFSVIQSGAMEIKTDFAKNLTAMREKGVSLAKPEVDAVVSMN